MQRYDTCKEVVLFIVAVVVAVVAVVAAVVFLQDGKTALIFAIDKGHTAIVEVLVAAGANKDLQTNVSAL